MPLLATFLSTVAAGIAEFLALFMSYRIALKIAAYTLFLSITAAFFVGVLVCLNLLWTLAAGFFGGSGSWGTLAGAIALALQAIVPSVASTVLACCSSVWIGTQVYKIQKAGLLSFH